MREYKFHPADGIPTTVLLSEEEAQKRGLKPVEDKPVETKVKTPANKARTPSEKRAAIAGKAWGAKNPPAEGAAE
jgi:hypothetical protein